MRCLKKVYANYFVGIVERNSLLNGVELCISLVVTNFVLKKREERVRGKFDKWIFVDFFSFFLFFFCLLFYCFIVMQVL